MFIAQQPLVTLTARDETESVAIVRLHVRSTVDRDTGLAAATQLRVLVEGVTGLSVQRQAIVFPFVETAPAPAGAGAAHQVGVFLFATSEPSQFVIVEIPGLSSAHLVELGAGAGLWIDPDDSAVAAFIDQMITGPWCNPFGYSVTELAAAFMQVRDQ